MQGLQFLHNMNIIHSDLKSANILVNDSLGCLADFGLSTIPDVSPSVRRGGALRRMAPELLVPNSEKIDLFKADIFSLAVTMLEVCEICILL